MNNTSPFRLQTRTNGLDFFVRGERFASYQEDFPGFTALFAPDYRAVAGNEENALALWMQHGNVNGVAFGPATENASETQGRIVPVETLARRGSQSLGFQQICEWNAPEDKTLLTETRTVRIVPGPAEGRVLDWRSEFRAPRESPVTFGLSLDSLLCLRLAPGLLPANGGQIRNSLGNYGIETLHGQSAGWLGAIGVLNGQTVGVAFLDHPGNLWHPAPWVVREDGLISPSPFGWRTHTLAPNKTLTLRYRLLVHRGYVDQNWAEERLRAFGKQP